MCTGVRVPVCDCACVCACTPAASAPRPPLLWEGARSPEEGADSWKMPRGGEGRVQDCPRLRLCCLTQSRGDNSDATLQLPPALPQGDIEGEAHVTQLAGPPLRLSLRGAFLRWCGGLRGGKGLSFKIQI